MLGLVDREKQVAALQRLWDKDGPGLALVYGRRRVGKTYFLKTFLEAHRGVYFLAAASTSAENLGELLTQIRRVFPDRHDVTLQNYPTWRVTLRLLCELARGEPLVVVLDEFGYLSHADRAVASLLQAVWDQDAPGSQLKLVLCGSELGVMSSLDDYGAPLHGRFDWIEHYAPLDYYDALPLIAGLGRWWNRRHDVEIDLVAEFYDGSYLFGEVKWATSPVRLGELFELERKVDALPHPEWKKQRRYAIFSGGGFEEKLVLVAQEQGVLLIGGPELYA